MLHASYAYMVVPVLVALAVAVVALLMPRHLRSFHSSSRTDVAHILRDDGELRFRTLAEALPRIVWTAIPGKGTDYGNRRWYELTGLTEQQTLGFGWASALHPDDRPVALENWEKCRVKGEPFEMEYRLQNSAGGYRWHLVRATPMADSSGAIVKWFRACADIDDQIRNQQVLEEQIRQHTAALMEANGLLQTEKRESRPGAAGIELAKRAHGARADQAFQPRHQSGQDGVTAAELHRSERRVLGGCRHGSESISRTPWRGASVQSFPGKA